MLAKQYRYSFKKGLPKHTLSTPFFTLRYGISSVDRIQCAVVVSKKVNKKAVIRNKIKRRFLHAFRQELENKEDAYSLVFFMKKGIQDMKQEEMKQEIQKVLKAITI
jgi:ribonuclease P protein component